MRNYYRPYRDGQVAYGRPAIPKGVKVLLITNATVYLLQLIIGREMVMLLGLTPVQVLQNLSVYQLFTYMFLHGGLFHILINMFVLWMFGSEIELTWGTRKFFKYYFLTGMAGGIFTVIFQPNSAIPTIGASGAIYGLLVAYAVMFPNRMIYLYFLIPLKVKYAVAVFVVLEFMASLSANPDGIGHLAHLGGAVVGFIYVKTDWRVSRFFRAISPKRMIENLRFKRKEHKINKNRQETEEIMKRVDQLLDKINAVGYENLSEEEKHFLGNASNILSKKEK